MFALCCEIDSSTSLLNKSWEVQELKGIAQRAVYAKSGAFISLSGLVECKTSNGSFSKALSRDIPE